MKTVPDTFCLALKGCVIVNKDDRDKIRDCDPGTGGKNLFLVTP